MEKQTRNMGLIIIGIVLIIFILIYLFLYRPLIPLMKQEKEMMRYCEERGLTRSIGACRCLMDCERLNLEYFKWHSSFGGQECWCKEGNGTKQIY